MLVKKDDSVKFSCNTRIVPKDKVVSVSITWKFGSPHSAASISSYIKHVSDFKNSSYASSTAYISNMQPYQQGRYFCLAVLHLDNGVIVPEARYYKSIVLRLSKFYRFTFMYVT